MYSESTLRRRAYKIGYQVMKGFTRYYGVVDYDWSGERSTGYMIKDLSYGFCVDGFANNYEFLMTIEDVEDFLKEQYEAQGLVW